MNQRGEMLDTFQRSIGLLDIACGDLAASNLRIELNKLRIQKALLALTGVVGTDLQLHQRRGIEVLVVIARKRAGSREGEKEKKRDTGN